MIIHVNVPKVCPPPAGEQKQIERTGVAGYTFSSPPNFTGLFSLCLGVRGPFDHRIAPQHKSTVWQSDAFALIQSDKHPINVLVNPSAMERAVTDMVSSLIRLVLFVSSHRIFVT